LLFAAIASWQAKCFFPVPRDYVGILPGIGGCVVPYRKWPQATTVFHEMLRLGKSVKVQEAQNIGMVKKVADGLFQHD